MAEKPTPPQPLPGSRRPILVTPSAKQHAEYAAGWLREHPDHPHRIYIERIREAAEDESHPGRLSDEIVRFIDAVEAEKKSDGGKGAQEIPHLP
jgi:hypothetical protein